MQRFKRHLIALSLISAIALPLTATAQEGNHPPKDPHHAAMASLELSAEQREALKELRQEFREERQALRDEQRAAIADILTEEQLATLDAAGEDHGGHQRDKPHHDGKRGEQQRERMEALLGSWDLSDADLATLREAHQTLRDEMRTLHEQDFDTRDDRRAAVEAIRDEHRETLAEVLDKDQLHALAVLMAPSHDQQRRGHHGREHHERGNHHDEARQEG